MFLNKYRNKGQLGRGFEGNVYLVADNKDNLYALKVIDAHRYKSNSKLFQLLRSEIQCLKTMDSPHIVKLLDFEQDEKNYYLLLEYCDGRNLKAWQSKLKNQVFPLDKAIQILAQAIQGLEYLHKSGFLHRDIKPQNLLIKNQKGKQICKLADFGFAKKKVDLVSTFLGTTEYMSPEIFGVNTKQGYKKEYGFEVDMWAFGVLFYYMLNHDYPFKINEQSSDQVTFLSLKKQAANFSYSSSLKSTSYKITANCTPEIQDLFKRIFEIDPERRITFSDIRKHPVFKNYFPEVTELSQSLYKSKFQPKNIQIKKEEQKEEIIDPNYVEDNVQPIPSIIRTKNQLFPIQKQILERKKDEIDFLKINGDELNKCFYITKIYQKLMLRYCIQKYYIILLRNFKSDLNPEALKLLYPTLEWHDYCKTKDFLQLYHQIDQDLNINEMDFKELYDNCLAYLKEIDKINPYFKANFSLEIKQKSLQKDFKVSYRKSTSYIYDVLRKQCIGNKIKGNLVYYLLSILLISHTFNNIFNPKYKDHQQVIFNGYFKEKSVDTIDYSELRSWLTSSNQKNLQQITNYIIRIYFPK